MLYIRFYCLLLLITSSPPGAFALRKIPVVIPHLRNALTDYSLYSDSPMQGSRAPERISLADDSQYRYGSALRPYRPRTPVRRAYPKKPVGTRLLNTSLTCLAIGIPLVVFGAILLNNRDLRGLTPLAFGVPLISIGLVLGIAGLSVGTKPPKKGS